MYKIKAVLSERWFKGNKVRSKKPITSIDLKTEIGVRRWLAEQAPFDEVTVYENGIDVTLRFLGVKHE